MSTPTDARLELQQRFLRHLHAHAFRLLGHMDRDPDSPTFGCFDRDFWHLKHKDFPSAILQQAALVLQAISDSPASLAALGGTAATYRSWADAALRFWAHEQRGCGAFDEYWPREESFPATAFSLYAAALLFRSRGFAQPGTLVCGAMQRACNWLMAIEETQVSNQEAAALAGLAVASHIPGITVDKTRLQDRVDRFLTRQSSEGWFPEYGGPDLGYLSVTTDALWDLFEATGNDTVRTALENAMRFLAALVTVSGEVPPMLGARNTDYILPHGLVRLAATDALAASLVHRLFARVGEPAHFLSRTDDRYMLHYTGQSCWRAAAHLHAMKAEAAPLPCDTDGDHSFPDAGLFVRHAAKKHSVLIAGKKGGVAYVYAPAGLQAADYGWRSPLGNRRLLVSHWQQPDATMTQSTSADRTTLTISSAMTAQKFLTPSSLYHLGLRILALFLGRHLRPWLKRVMILRPSAQHVPFVRRLVLESNRMTIEDRFTANGAAERIWQRAPVHSLRWVPSAGQCTPEDLLDPSQETATPSSQTATEVCFTRCIEF